MAVNAAQRELQLLAARFVADPDEFEFPEDMVCPITQTLMADPVSVAQEGHVFDRAAIANWFQTHDTNPVTNTRLARTELTPCIPVRKRINNFRDAVTRLGGGDKLPGASIAPVAQKLQPKTYTPPEQQRVALASREIQPAARNAREGSAEVRFTPLQTSIPTRREALKVLRKCPVDSGNYMALIGTYLQSKKRNVAGRTVVSTEYQYSDKAIAAYNHVMHKLERLGGPFLAGKTTPPGARAAWEAALKPFRRQLYDSLCRRLPSVLCFARNIPGGRMQMPELDDWSLGLKSNSWFGGLAFPAAAAYAGALSESAVECLQQVQTVFLIDDSGSMALAGHSSWAADPDYRARAESRWQQVRALLAQVAPLVTRHDPKGIDVHFLNSAVKGTGLRSAEQVMALFAQVRTEPKKINNKLSDMKVIVRRW